MWIYSRCTSEEREIAKTSLAGGKEDVPENRNSISKHRDEKACSGKVQSFFVVVIVLFDLFGCGLEA